jgi:hypothetical protein
MIVYHVIFLSQPNHMMLAKTFTAEADALNWIHGKERVHPVDAYIIMTGRAVRK